MKRAKKLLESENRRRNFAGRSPPRRNQLELEHRDLNLILALDRAADSNEIQLLMPISFSSVTSRRFTTRVPHTRHRSLGSASGRRRSHG